MDAPTKTSAHGELQDRVRSALLSFGERDIDVTIDQLIPKTGLSYPQIYQTLYRLQRNGELEIISEQSDNGRQRVVGVQLSRMAPLEAIESRVSERAVAKRHSSDFVSLAANLPTILDYINQKLAIEKAREQIMKTSTLNPDDVISFAPNPLGEEAILILSKYQEAIERIRVLEIDLEAEQRNVRFLKERTAGVTFDDSGT